MDEPKILLNLIDNNGKVQTLDLSIFSFDRLLPGGTPVLDFFEAL
jgi:hypothetical protein